MNKKSSFIDKSQPKNILIGIWASIVSAIMLIGIGAFWVIHPNATEGSFSLVPDSETAIFKAVGDIIPSFLILLTAIELIPTVLILWFRTKPLNTSSL